jgi:hypothetical protein
MNLYLVSQEENTGYDTYDSFVVAAPDEETARDTSPHMYFDVEKIDWSQQEKDEFCDWANHRDRVTVQLIGTAVEGTQWSVICASFNAD